LATLLTCWGSAAVLGGGGSHREAPGMEGLLVQFMVMRLPSCTLVKQCVTDGNSMGLILEARNVHPHTHFSDLRVDTL
jgi:hypothetical protein